VGGAEGAHRALREVGWVWEGQGMDPGVPPSIFGVGDGAAFFGLRRAIYIFHPNNALGLRKLAHLDEVVCDISKWKFQEAAPGSWRNYIDARPEVVRAEAENLSRLSLDYPNVTGGFHDDMLGLLRREGYTPQRYADIYAALKSVNRQLKLWAVVYSHELKRENWEGFLPYIDVVTLWIWRAVDIPNMDESIRLCRQLFPRKPLYMGCYLRDYSEAAPVPMHLLKQQWEGVRRNLDIGNIDGFSILGTVLIDGQQEQAEWVRDFIAAN
jgi:hypothetical protein